MIYLNETNSEEISNVITNLKDSNSTDIYDLSTKFIKIAAPGISQNLTHIFNKSIQEGVFPNLYKVAKVVPLHKNGSTLIVSNFRPISLLPILSKIFERLLYSRLISFINTYSILTDAQYGFQTNKSTELAVNALTNKII